VVPQRQLVLLRDTRLRAEERGNIRDALRHYGFPAGSLMRDTGRGARLIARRTMLRHLIWGRRGISHGPELTFGVYWRVCEANRQKRRYDQKLGRARTTHPEPGWARSTCLRRGTRGRRSRACATWDRGPSAMPQIVIARRIIAKAVTAAGGGSNQKMSSLMFVRLSQRVASEPAEDI
jgi:hypothetical protein